MSGKVQIRPQNYATRLWFPDGAAPFGELNLVRADHGFDKNSPADNFNMDAFEASAPKIARQAWAESGWLRQELDQEQLDVFANQDWDELQSSVGRIVYGSAHIPNTQRAWFAVRPPEKEPETGDGLLKGLGRFIMPSQVVGFANAKHDVSGNPLQRAIKRRRHPEKIYAAVPNVDVLPREQHKYIGAALLYVSLDLFEPEQYPTTYVAESNPDLIAKLGELGYRQTGSQPRSDLIDGAVIEEVRLQADSVAAVRSRLRSRGPWLVEAVPAWPQQWP